MSEPELTSPEGSSGESDGESYAGRRRLADFGTEVAPEWIDYNGHMSEAYYVLVFGFATDQAMEVLGLGPEYRRSTGCSLYTVESHIRYLSEVSLGTALTVRAHLVTAGEKKIHLAYEMTAGGVVVATEEILALHVDQQVGSTVPFPAEVTLGLDAISRHRPEWSGRRIG